MAYPNKVLLDVRDDAKVRCSHHLPARGGLGVSHTYP
jgi:hypothetical protein